MKHLSVLIIAALLLGAQAARLESVDPAFYSYNRIVHLPPYRWYDADLEQMAGFTPLLVEAVSRALGEPIVGEEIVGQPPELPDIVLERMAVGSIDISFFPHPYRNTEESLLRCDTPAYVVKTQLFRRKNTLGNYEGWQQLKGLTGGYVPQVGISGNEDFDAFAHQYLSLNPFKSYEAMASALTSGEVDYIVGMKRPLMIEFRLLGSHRKVEPFGDSLVAVPIYWTLSPLSPMALERQRIDRLLASFDQSGRKSRMLNRAMQDYIDYRKRQRQSSTD